MIARSEFQRMIYGHYRAHARDLPWRKTRDPYRILVSEVMLQQTPVGRVVKKYDDFLAAFPDFASLSRAPLRKILLVWQGLGYNRRAIALKNIARIVTERYDGTLPSDPDIVATLPGIGRATAASIAAFAHNAPVVFIETNIRSVFIHTFYKRRHVKDDQILLVAEKMLDRSHPRRWYCALMDYGAMLKKKVVNPNRKSAHYRPQARFEGSDRQVRGMILKTLTAQPCASLADIVHALKVPRARVVKNLDQLRKEGFMGRRGRCFFIA